MQSLPLYDIDRLCVAHSAMQARGLKNEELTLAVESVDTDAIAQLMAEHTHVLSF